MAPQLNSQSRILSLVVLNGEIYGGTYNGGRLFKWSGVDAWIEVAPQLSSQINILSLAALDGHIYGGTDPNGRLFQWNGVPTGVKPVRVRVRKGDDSGWIVDELFENLTPDSWNFISGTFTEGAGTGGAGAYMVFESDTNTVGTWFVDDVSLAWVVGYPPVVTFFIADPPTIDPGGQSTLSWSTSGADTVNISPGIGMVASSDSTTVSPASTTTYELTATNAFGSTPATATVTVRDTEAPTFSWSDPVDQSSNPTQGGAVVLRAAFADASGIRSIKIYDKDENLLETYYASQFERDLGSLTEGSYKYKLVAEDNSGNTMEKWIEFTEYYPAPEDVDLGLDENEQQGGGGLVGARVRILVGNTIESRTDLSFPSPNRMGLGLRAYYNSRSSFAGAMGFGWSHAYEESLSSGYAYGTMTLLRIMDQTGRAHYFKEDTSGHYKGFFKAKSYVTMESGQYLWHKLDGSRSCFDLSGRLQWIEDEKGNRINLSYNAQGKVESVSDAASDRILTFHYDETGRLSSISGPITTAVPDGYWVSGYGYDVDGNLTTVTYADDSGFTYAYEDGNDVHNLTEKRNKASHLLGSWGYDASDRAISNFSADGRGANIEYTSDILINVSDAYNVIRSYTIGNIMGRKRVTDLTGVANAPYGDNSIVHWAYDQEMRLEQVTTAGAAIHRYEDYDAKGHPGTVRLAAGTALERVITYTYHSVTNVPLSRSEQTTIGESGNKVTVWDYDSDYNTTPNETPTPLLSRLVETGFTTDGSGNVVPYNYVTIFTYNSKGQVLTVDGPRSGTADTNTFTYNAIMGDLLTVARPIIGNSTLSEYDAAGRPGTVTDENDQSKTFLYDGRSRVARITNNADSSFTEIVYNPAGQPQTVTDSDSVTHSFVYDTSYGHLTRIEDADGNYIQYQYDTQGNRTEMSKHDPSGLRTSRKRWSYQHPLMPGKLWKEINADDSYTEYGYDSDGNVSSVKNPEEFTTNYVYDYLNRLIQVTQPGSVITGYGYDRHGNLASVTDAENHQTTYVYDDMGRLVETQSPDTGIVSYGYDEAGNLTSKLDAKEIDVTYTYDAMNRLTAIQFPDTAQNITYTYDIGTNGKGHLTGMTDQSGSMTLTYDARGRLFQKMTNIAGHQYTYSQTYTPGDKVQSVTYPSGRTLDYTRDSMKRMQVLSTTYDSSTVNLVSNMTYKPFGGPKGMSTGAGGVVDNQAGECDCITVANPGTMMEQQYTYDRNRNLLSVVAPNAPQYNQTLTYDALNRLATAEGRYGSMSYTYDKVGNRLTETLNGQTDNYTYFSNTNRLQEITGANPLSFTYDANGNITGMGTKTLTYNQDNRLIEVTENGTPLGTYTYNGKGERVKKVAGGNTTIYHYDFDGKLIAESITSGMMRKEYLYMGQIRMAMVDVQPQTISYYLNDRLGTPEMMTDNTSKVVWEGMYKPFGEASVHPMSTVVNNIRLPGQYYDSETGLHYNYHRYYQPQTGRYVTPDPMGLRGGINLFAYVNCNPLNLTDPLGLFPWTNPIQYWMEFVGGAHDFWLHYWNMVDANTIGADKYFHCMANCQASRRGLGGRDVSKIISEGRELRDEYLKGDPRWACDEDRAANLLGALSDPDIPCSDACGSMRPNGLPFQY